MQLEQISKPHEIFCDWEHMDPAAVEQFRKAMEQPYVTRGALMPDTHKGYSLPIGAVVETEGVIVPAWVGYDIGCGMCALPTTFKKEEVRSHALELHKAIHEAVPVGQNKHTGNHALPKGLRMMSRSQVVEAAIQKRDGLNQFGTLGGGNHFIEIGYDEADTVWIIIHSGSRGTGHEVAGTYMKAAAEHHGVTKGNLEGHYGLDLMSNLGWMYNTDLNWCLAYALENRKEMLTLVLAAMASVIDGNGLWLRLINRNHNHAEVKGDKIIHRKGATHAEEGMMGVIPGNMKDGSYIVCGKGNEASLCSSSHGAGRVLSRRKAKETLDDEYFRLQMEGIASDAGRATLDEAPQAYKPIKDVMDMQKDLIHVTHHVTPLISVKG